MAHLSRRIYVSSSEEFQGPMLIINCGYDRLILTSSTGISLSLSLSLYIYIYIYRGTSSRSIIICHGIPQSNGFTNTITFPSRRVRSQLGRGLCRKDILCCDRSHPACAQCKKKFVGECVHLCSTSNQGR